MARPRTRHYETGTSPKGKADTVRVSVTFSKEQMAEIDLRADSLDMDRSNYIKMEFLKGIGWIEKRREQLERQRLELVKKPEI